MRGMCSFITLLSARMVYVVFRWKDIGLVNGDF